MAEGKNTDASSKGSGVKSRRKTPPKSDAELYQLPESIFTKFIRAERRQDERERLEDIQEQKKDWQKTLTFYAVVMVLLVLLSMWGLVWK